MEDQARDYGLQTYEATRILVVDDDPELCELLTEYLGRERFDVTCVHTAEESLSRLDDNDLVIVDVMLPGMDGFELLRRIRRNSMKPVIMLTAKGDEIDRILGLELGADDYISKPFSPRELLARVRAILRRSQAGVEEGATEGEKIELGDLELDPSTRTVWQEGKPLDLTTAEFDLLERLLRSAGSPVSREELCETALRRPLNPYDRSIDMLVSQVRRKLGWKVGELDRIKTIRGVGYMYVLVPELTARR